MKTIKPDLAKIEATPSTLKRDVEAYLTIDYNTEAPSEFKFLVIKLLWYIACKVTRI